MSLNYTWRLTGLKKTNTDNAQDVIIGTRWELTGTDEEGNSGTFSGATPFKLEDVELHNFVPFENLDQDTVIGWIQAEVVGGYKDHIDGRILEQIKAVKNAEADVSHTEFPWLPAVEPVAEAPVDPVAE